MVETAAFYTSIPPIEDFTRIFSSEEYREVPDDWSVVITDVKGSTRAIEAGRYRDVNTLGVATIVAAQNAMGRRAFPYVFGGDGATMLLPPGTEGPVLTALRGVRKLARDKFDLELRVGRIAVAEVRRLGGRIEVARLQLVGTTGIALFRGGGLILAERCVKDHPEDHEISEDGDATSDLTGLSCRWRPIPPTREVVASILVASSDPEHDPVYQRTLERITRILSDDIDEHNPVNLSRMAYKPFWDSVRDELRYHESVFSLAWFARFAEIIAAVFIFAFKVPPLVFDASAYAESMRTHSDFRKFDDMLRMVVDCTHDQLARIRAVLEAEREAGTLFYGVHEAPHALMTCVVHEVRDGEHIHFVDGGDGGYAVAAKELKAQMRNACKSPPSRSSYRGSGSS